MVKIQFTLPNGEEHLYELTEQHYSIGRVDGNDIHLEHSSVSSKHAELVWNGETYELNDLDSTNGTKVNDITIERQALYSGNKLELGEVQGLYTGDGAAAAATATVLEEMPTQTGDAVESTPAADPWAEPEPEPVRPAAAARSKKAATSGKVSGFGPRVKQSDPLATFAMVLGLLAILICAGALFMTSQLQAG